MNRNSFAVCVLSLLTSMSVFADPTAPTCAPTAEDSVLLQGQTARAFFAARTASSDCTTKFQQAKAAFDDARAQLQKLAASGADTTALDNQETAVNAARTPYLAAMAECGPCAAQPAADPTVIEGDHKQVWYQMDGSCQLPVTDKARLGRVFDKMSDMLSRFSQYPRQAKTADGFNPILALYAINQDGSPAANVDKLPADKPTPAFIAIQGPLITSFSYFFNGTDKVYGDAGSRQYWMHEEGISPAGVRAPRTVSYLTAGGRKKTAINSALAGANGQWYLNEDGYLRYCTSADFGTQSSFVKNFGQSILLDILSTAYDKAATTE